jgi:hypothetical protein
MKTFVHFIITRFNVVDNDRFAYAEKLLATDEVYLQERFRLFDIFCLPSIVNQTNSNFIWLCLFYENTPQNWKEKIETYKKYSNFKPYFLSEQATTGENFIQTLCKIIHKEVKNIKADFIITTRIDNDDAVNLNFVNNLQEYFFKNQQEAIVNFPNGLQYILKFNVLKNVFDKKGHFSTRIEKNDNSIETVLAFNHHNLPKNIKFVCIKNKNPMWLEVLHNTNAANSIYFQVRFLLKDLFYICLKNNHLRNFGINQQIPKCNFYTWKLFFEWFCKEIMKVYQQVLDR